MRRRVRATRAAALSRIFCLIACGAATGCENSASPELVVAAKSAHSAEVASAAVAGVARPPLGAVPVLVEEAFRTERPSSFASPTKSNSCALDTVEGAPCADVATVRASENVRLVGWAADGSTETVPPIVVLELTRGKKSLYARARRITKRPDVAAASKVQAFSDSGYDVLANFQGVEPGEYSVTVLQVTDAGNALACDTRKKLKIE